MYNHINKNVFELPGKERLLIYSGYVSSTNYVQFYLYNMKTQTFYPCPVPRLQQQFPYHCASLYFLDNNDCNFSDITPVLGSVDLELCTQGPQSVAFHLGVSTPETIICSQYSWLKFEFNSTVIKMCSHSKDINPTNDTYYSILCDCDPRDKGDENNYILPPYNLDRSFEVNFYKNFVFIFSCTGYHGGYHLTMLKVSSDASNKRATFELIGNLKLKSKFSECGYTCSGPACIIIDASTQCKEYISTHVKFLIFGGKTLRFKESFHEITVNIEQDLASGDIMEFGITKEVQLKQNSDNWIKNLDKWSLYR